MMKLPNKIHPFLIYALSIFLMPSLSQAGETLDRIMKKGVLTFATDANQPPTSFINQKNELDGFDVEVGNEIARRLNVKPKIVTPEWSIITAGHWNGRWDISVGSMVYTAARAMKFNFPAVYYQSPAHFAVHNGSPIQTKEQLNGKIIGAVSGTSYESYLLQNLQIGALSGAEIKYNVKAGTIKTLATTTGMMGDLRLGPGVRLDAMISTKVNFTRAIESGYPFRIVGAAEFNEPMSIAIEKNDMEFNDKLAEIIKAMHDDGTLKRLSMKWFGEDFSKIDQ